MYDGAKSVRPMDSTTSTAIVEYQKIKGGRERVGSWSSGCFGRESRRGVRRR